MKVNGKEVKNTTRVDPSVISFGRSMDVYTYHLTFDEEDNFCEVIQSGPTSVHLE